MIQARILNTCKWAEPDDYCFNLVEGNTDFCARHNRLIRKEQFLQTQATEKRKKQIEKAKSKNQQKRKPISKNPKDWGNTFLCSDGTRVTQAVIIEKLKQTYSEIDDCFCCGCGQVGNSHAHIIPQARCKHIGKTELIWHRDNIFWSDFKCNQAIENPKGKAWKRLRNIDKCLLFIKQHDPELFAKFELSAVNQETPTI